MNSSDELSFLTVPAGQAYEAGPGGIQVRQPVSERGGNRIGTTL
jgi:hypothetical protein